MWHKEWLLLVIDPAKPVAGLINHNRKLLEMRLNNAAQESPNYAVSRVAGISNGKRKISSFAEARYKFPILGAVKLGLALELEMKLSQTHWHRFGKKLHAP